MPQSAPQELKTAAELSDEQRGLLGVSARDNTLFAMHDDGFCVARVRPWRPGLLPHVDVQSVRRWAEERAQRVKSVVVFGSHARGTNHRHSDVDVLVVGRLSGKDKSRLRNVLSPASVDIVERTSATKFRAGVAERHLSIENQVMRQGVLVFGSIPGTEIKLKKAQFPMDERAFLSHFEAAMQITSKCLVYLPEYMSDVGEHGLEVVSFRGHVADSSDAAERTAKAFLICVGLSPEHKHDVPALIAQLLRESHQRRATRTLAGLPSAEVLAARLEAMNHETASQALHRLVYHEGGVYMHHPDGRELVINANERFARVIDNLVWLFAIIKSDGDYTDLAQSCQRELESCFRIAMRRESDHVQTNSEGFEQLLGMRTSLPVTLQRTSSEFEALTSG